jgi:hypothetical protein
MVKEKKETALLGADNSKEPGRCRDAAHPKARFFFFMLISTK